MNQRIAKTFRRAVAKKDDLPMEERHPMYKQIKQEYVRYGFLHSQNPKPVKTKRQRRLAKMIQKLKDKAA